MNYSDGTPIQVGDNVIYFSKRYRGFREGRVNKLVTYLMQVYKGQYPNGAWVDSQRNIVQLSIKTNSYYSPPITITNLKNLRKIA